MKSALLVFVTLGAGCADVESAAEPAVAATDLLAFGTSSPSSGGPHDAFGAFACDASPELEEIDLCGVSVMGSASLEWEDCETDGVTTSGHVIIAAHLEGSCEDGDAVLVRDVEIERTIETPRGTMEAALTGTLSAMPGDGQVTLDGALALVLDHPYRGTLEHDLSLEAVVRTPDCAWPVAGAVVRTLGDQEMVLELGPECGEATLNGEALDLDAEAARGRGGRPGARP